MAKFPDVPTTDEKTALSSYIHLFARLYPWYHFVFSHHQVFDCSSSIIDSIPEQRRVRHPLSADSEQISAAGFNAVYRRRMGMSRAQRSQ